MYPVGSRGAGVVSIPEGITVLIESVLSGSHSLRPLTDVNQPGGVR